MSLSCNTSWLGWPSRLGFWLSRLWLQHYIYFLYSLQSIYVRFIIILQLHPASSELHHAVPAAGRLDLVIFLDLIKGSGFRSVGGVSLFSCQLLAREQWQPNPGGGAGDGRPHLHHQAPDGTGPWGVIPDVDSGRHRKVSAPHPGPRARGGVIHGDGGGVEADKEEEA